MENVVSCSNPDVIKPSEVVADVFRSPAKALCLSAALENLPLVYLPQTKQLVTASGWSQDINRRHSTNSPSHGHAACTDIPEFCFPDDGSAAKNMAGSKISEDSGYPGLWDSDVSLSRDIRSERNSSVGSSDILECELDAVNDEDATSDELTDSGFKNSNLSQFSCLDISSTGHEVCSADCLQGSVAEDLKDSSVSNLSSAEGKSTSCSAMQTHTREAGGSNVDNHVQKVDKPKRGTLASFFSGLD